MGCMGGGMGGMGGMGGGGGGGVTIDPRIRLKQDSSGKLDELRTKATGKSPNSGSFAQ